MLVMRKPLTLVHGIIVSRNLFGTLQKKKISAVKHTEKYLTDNNDNNGNVFVKEAKNLLGRFLQRGTLSSSEIDDHDLIATVHLRALGIVKSQDNYFEFTSNIIFDLL